MPVAPHEILSVAKQLGLQGSNEATLRSAVSRAYYAALHRADEIFPHRSSDQNLGNDSSHTKIISRSQAYANGINPGRSAALSVAKFLPKMKRSRVQADYHLEATITAKDSADAIGRADQVLVWCDEIAKKIAESNSATAAAAAPETNSVAASPSATSKPTLVRIR